MNFLRTKSGEWRILLFGLLLFSGIGFPAESGETGVTPVSGYRVVRTYPHDPEAFTQGLVWEGDVLYEGTGLKGSSELRKVDLETGRVLKSVSLPDRHFGEGIAVFGDRIYQLTLNSGIAFVYRRESLSLLTTFRYPGEGWGLAHDGKRLIMSDGTPVLRFIDPDTFRETGRLTVTDGGAPVAFLNELEYVNGEIFANVWQTDRIARISPETGRVTGWIDLAGILPPTLHRVDVLNGIAYDPKTGRLLVTGKLWPTMFEIVLVPRG